VRTVADEVTAAAVVAFAEGATVGADGQRLSRQPPGAPAVDDVGDEEGLGRRGGTPKGRFRALRRMGATHIAAPRTQHWLKRFFSSWTHPGAYFISFFMTHFQAATTIGW